MSEPKRVHLETNGVKKLSSNSSAAAARKTVRLELDLSTAELYPEFNYFDLVAAEKTKLEISQLNGFGAFEDENTDDIKRLALEFERKYGDTYKGCGPNKRRMNTSVYDKGSGYDQSDPFIDDAIKYDENVPDEMEPDHGGFYINSGPLQFKRLANFERPEDAHRMPKPRKRIISNSDSNESNDAVSNAENLKNGHPDKKPKLTIDKEKQVNKDVVKSKAKPNAADGNVKKEVKETTMKDLLREKRDNHMRNIADGANTNKISGQMSTTEDSSSVPASSDSSDDEEEENANVSDVESVAKNTEKLAEKSPTVVVASTSEQLPPVAAMSETNGETIAEPVEVKLPENLPEPLLQNIKKMEELAKTTPNVFATKETLDLLYEIDTLATMSKVQQIICRYLAPRLSCSINKISSEMKKLRVDKEEEKLKPLYERLRLQINTVMPIALAEHERKMNEFKAAAASAVSKEGDKPEQTPKKPRFPWNADLRKTMDEIVTLMRHSYKRIGKRADTEQAYIEQYFFQYLLPLWPNGWMRINELRQKFMKDVNQRRKENKNPTDKTSNPTTKHPTTTAPKKPKPAPTTVPPNNNIVRMTAIDLAANEKTIKQATTTVKTDKRLSDITSKVTGTSAEAAIITSANLTPADIKSLLPSTTNPSNKTVKANQDQRVIHSSTAAVSSKQLSNTKLVHDGINNSIEIMSSPEKNSPSKKASDHSINHIISVLPIANNSKTAVTATATTQQKSNAPNANPAFNNFDSMKSKSQPSKGATHSNIVSNHSKVTNTVQKNHAESPVHVIKDSSSDDEVQIVDDKPKHVAFASSSLDPKAIKHKRDKVKTNVNASVVTSKPRPPKSILKSPHSVRDPLADDDDIRNARSTMNALKELEPRRIN